MISKIILILTFAIAIPSALGLACSQDWECMSVSNDYNFVKCQAGVCTCKTSFGFAGSATTEDKCSCSAPANIYWGQGNPYCKACVAPSTIIYKDGIPYCVDPAECEASKTEEQRQAKHQDVVTQIYQNLIYPTPLFILGGAYPIDNLFSPSVKGRVTPVGAFNDFLNVEEYFYALAATPGSFVVDIFIKSLVSTGNKVGVEVDILFNNTQGLHNLTQMGFYEFDSTDRVKTLDLVILNLGAASDPPVEARPFAIQQLCGLLVQTCSNPAYDPNGYYTSFDDCVSYMNSIEYGTWDRANSNTVTCRQLHSLLTLSRPEVHCSHSGKTGGGKCIDWSYQSFYEVEY